MHLFDTLKINISKPLRFIKGLCSKKNLRLISDQLYNPAHSDEKKALSAAFGIFMGIIPIWGFQTLAALFLAVVFKLNKTLVGVFLLISFPPLIPLILFLSYRMGSYWIDNSATIAVHTKNSIQSIDARLGQYIYGSITLAIAASTVVGLLTFAALKLIKAVKTYKLTALKKAF
jgi:uncharacterized protein (DUF2062 family)